MVDLRKWMDDSQQAGDMSGIDVRPEMIDKDNDNGMIFLRACHTCFDWFVLHVCRAFALLAVF
jgi:hypothetical protein